jgi:hypothetical protein
MHLISLECGCDNWPGQRPNEIANRSGQSKKKEERLMGRKPMIALARMNARFASMKRASSPTLTR